MNTSGSLIHSLLIVCVLSTAPLSSVHAQSKSNATPVSGSGGKIQSQSIEITSKGRTYHNCRFLRQDVTGVSFAHDSGIAKFALSELPPEIRSQYPDVSKPVPAVVSTPSYNVPVREPIVIQQPTAQAPQHHYPDPPTSISQPSFSSYEPQTTDEARFQRLAEQKGKELEPLFEQKAKELEPYFERAANQINITPGMSEAEIMRQIDRAAESMQPFIDQKAEEMQPYIEQKGEELMREMGW